MNDIKVSVVIPIYSGEEFISSAIESVLRQTYSNLELIIVLEKGASTSISNLLDDFSKKDKRVIVYKNDTKLGISASLNKGIELSNGKYIARMDGDDICYPDRLEKQVEFLQNNMEVGVLGTNVRFVDENGRSLERYDDYPNDNDRIVTDMFFLCCMRHPTVMFRADTLKKYNLKYDVSYRAAEDYELWIRASKVTKFANLSEVLLDYRWYKKNATHILGDLGEANTKAVIKRNISSYDVTLNDSDYEIIHGYNEMVTIFNRRKLLQIVSDLYHDLCKANERLEHFSNKEMQSTFSKLFGMGNTSIRYWMFLIIKSIINITGLNRISTLKISILYWEDHGLKKTWRYVISRLWR